MLHQPICPSAFQMKNHYVDTAYYSAHQSNTFRQPSSSYQPTLYNVSSATSAEFIPHAKQPSTWRAVTNQTSHPSTSPPNSSRSSQLHRPAHQSASHASFAQAPQGGTSPKAEAFISLPPPPLSPSDFPPLAGSPPAVTERDITMYVSESESYSICHPNWWSVSEPQPGSVLFVSPRTRSNEFCENISVVIEDLSQQPELQDLTDYTQQALKQLNIDAQYQVLHSAASTLCAMRAHEIIYTGNHNGLNLVFKQIWFIHNAKAYIVTFTCEATRFQSTFQFAQNLLCSFRLLGSNPQTTHGFYPQ
mmetsp:Transcript_21628/g.30245  ORF Transcript_21628/g.30245 Transcript_21628/m.30245 type:complete len:304 (-) Transcript_21628:56-967(-)